MSAPTPTTTPSRAKAIRLNNSHAHIIIVNSIARLGINIITINEAIVGTKRARIRVIPIRMFIDTIVLRVIAREAITNVNIVIRSAIPITTRTLVLSVRIIIVLARNTIIKRSIIIIIIKIDINVRVCCIILVSNVIIVNGNRIERIKVHMRIRNTPADNTTPINS